MSTEQSYVGRGSYATNPRPFAQKVSFNLQSYCVTPQQSALTARINQAQKRLLCLVDLFAARGNYAPLQAADDLLTYWCATPVETLAREADRDQLHAVLLLIDSLSEVYPITSLPTLSQQDQPAEPLFRRGKHSLRLSPLFLNRFDLSEDEEDRAGLIVAPDASMAPQILVGTELLTVAYERDAYSVASGVVVVALNDAPTRRMIGRIAHNKGGAILLLRDNPQFAEQTLRLADIQFLASVRSILSRPVL